jgi:hypothetical protein
MVVSIITYVALGLLMLIGLALTPLGLPGNWLILACAMGYGFITGWDKFGWEYIALLAGAAFAGEILEFLSASAGARRYGSSRGGEVAALIGSLGGAVIGAGVGFLVGALLGAFAGAFLAVFVYEYARLNDSRQAVRAGMGALVGKTVAVIMKEVIGVAMVGSLVYFFFV